MSISSFPHRGGNIPRRARQHFDAPRVFEKIYNDLLDFKAVGGVTVVDVSGIGIGRDIEFYVCLSRYTQVNIVACTGFWAERKILPYFAERGIDYHRSEERRVGKE